MGISEYNPEELQNLLRQYVGELDAKATLTLEVLEDMDLDDKGEHEFELDIQEKLHDLQFLITELQQSKGWI